jgi:glycine cleavage system H protein
MNVPEDLRYSSEHEWVSIDGALARVGITDYAQSALGDVVYVQLPDVGANVMAGASCAEVESTKSVSDIYSPLSGTVVEVNELLVDGPERVNQEPYGAGWIFVVEMADPSELDALLDPEAYRRLLDEE